MKRKYAKPNVSIDVFEANEYIATCIVGVCDTPINANGNENVMYIDKNNILGYQEADERITSVNNTPCNEPFVEKGGTVYSYMYDSNGTNEGGTVRPVYFWQVKRPFYYNHHATSGYKETGSSTA